MIPAGIFRCIRDREERKMEDIETVVRNQEVYRCFRDVAGASPGAGRRRDEPVIALG